MKPLNRPPLPSEEATLEKLKEKRVFVVDVLGPQEEPIILVGNPIRR